MPVLTLVVVGLLIVFVCLSSPILLGEPIHQIDLIEDVLKVRDASAQQGGFITQAATSRSSTAA